MMNCLVRRSSRTTRTLFNNTTLATTSTIVKSNNSHLNLNPLVVISSFTNVRLSFSTTTRHNDNDTSSTSLKTQYPHRNNYNNNVNNSTSNKSSSLPLPPNLFIDPTSSFASGSNIKSTTSNEKNNKKLSFKNTKSSQSQQEKQQNQQTKGSTSIPSEISLSKDEALQVSELEDEEFDEEEYDEYDDDIDNELNNYTNDPALGPPIIATPLPERLTVNIHSLNSSQYDNIVGTITLDDSVFGCDPIRVDLIKRGVDYVRNQIRGVRTAHTKTIAEVAGSGRKRRQQKGTGSARMGHRRPAHHRGGAKAHGPNKHYNTDYSNCKLNKKVMNACLRAVLSQKLKENNLVIFQNFNNTTTIQSHKTKHLVQLLSPWNIGINTATSDTALILDYYFPEKDDTSDNTTVTSTDEASAVTTSSTTTSTTNTPSALSYKGVPINLYVASSNLYQIKVGNALHNFNVYDAIKYKKLILTVSALQHLQSRLHVD